MFLKLLRNLDEFILIASEFLHFNKAYYSHGGGSAVELFFPTQNGIFNDQHKLHFSRAEHSGKSGRRREKDLRRSRSWMAPSASSHPPP